MFRSRATPSHIRHRLSTDVEIVVLYEACFDVLPKFMFVPGEGLAGKQPPGTAAAYMTPDKSRIACFQFGCCLVRLAGAEGSVLNVLIDTGLGCTDVPGYIPANAALRPLVDTLRTAGVEPAAVHMVVHTHLHGDHVGWNVRPAADNVPAVGDAPEVPTFPNATHWVHANEWLYAQHEGCPWAELTRQKFGPLQAAGMLQLFEGEGGAIDPARAPQLSFVFAPGHTPGHIAVCVTPDGEAAPRAVYVGDALHVRCAHTARAACATCTACAACAACTAHSASPTA